ncbi:MAG: hypothetical protein ACI4WX_11770 [Aristaeellaceae bacterium]
MYSIEVILHFRSSNFSSICDTASEALDAVCNSYEAVTGNGMTHDAREDWMVKLLSIRSGKMISSEFCGITVRRAG